MRGSGIIGAALLATSPVSAAPPTAHSSPAARSSLPADVVAFRTRRESCDHLRGEDADDEARAAQIAREAAKACTGTDAQLRWLKLKYAGDPKVKALLAPYDPQVE